MLTLQQVAVGPPPLPGGVAAVLRFFFNLPQWFQIAGFIVGVIVAAIVLVVLWRRRRILVAWVVSRPRSLKITLASGAAAIILGFAGVGVVGYDYMEHNNGFCTGCHVMKAPFQRFAGSKHDSLSCHACHQQSMFANMRQLYLWVAERPQSIGMHAKVPTRICASCHVRGDAKETWQRIASTAGHRTHLESDSSALKNVECLTCHARTAHRFQPADTTCAQKGCHLTEDTRIRLGRMAARFDPAHMKPLPNEEQLYCNSCHQFTAEAQFVSLDSASATLRPAQRQCLGCHEMQLLLKSFDPAADPHRGGCGMCHNPHRDVAPKQALKSCAQAGCHSAWRSVPFHMGAAHRKVAPRCETCHVPHAARVDASDCTGCHAQVRKRGGGLRPPMPFDTTRALRES